MCTYVSGMRIAFVLAALVAAAPPARAQGTT
jgi:hypothetical protein